MKTTCPYCYKPFDTAKTKEGENNALKLALTKFGLEVDLVVEYLNCFRVTPDSTLAHKKTMRVLKELVKMWTERYFAYRGRDWSTTPEQIAAAMTIACNRQLTGLGNHNYIKAILHKGAVQADIRAEQDKHARAASRPRTPEQGMARVGTGGFPASSVPLAGDYELDEATMQRIAETRRKLGCKELVDERGLPVLSAEEEEAGRLELERLKQKRGDA